MGEGDSALRGESRLTTNGVIRGLWVVDRPVHLAGR
jgi:hypothetical protein